MLLRFLLRCEDLFSEMAEMAEMARVELLLWARFWMQEGGLEELPILLDRWDTDLLMGEDRGHMGTKA